MAETTYNVTFPHTSPEIRYGASNWYADCPTQNGHVVCGDVSGNVQGSHFSNVSSASLTIYFYGKSLYLYGDADAGMSLSLTINYMENPITLSPSNGVLASIDDFTTHCTNIYECTDYTTSNTGAGLDYNTATVTGTQYAVGSIFRFTKAVFLYPTQRSGATVSINTYQNNDTRLQFTTGWARNGSYYQTGDQLAQQFTLAFNGQAIWVWEFCGQRSAFDFGDYGKFTINGQTDYAETYGSSGNIPEDQKCLAWFKADLYDTGNSLTFDSEQFNIQLHSIDVLQVSGGTLVTTTATLGYSTSVPTSQIGTTAGPSKAVMIAVPVVMICVAVAAGIAIALLIRRSRKRNGAAAGFFAPGQAMNSPETKATDASFHTPSQNQGYLTYTPPPPVTPAPGTVTALATAPAS